MKRWTSTAAMLALTGGFANVFAESPVVRLSPTVRELVQAEPVVASPRFWCDLPAPSGNGQPPLLPVPKAPVAEQVGTAIPSDPEPAAGPEMPVPSAAEACRLVEAASAGAVGSGAATPPSTPKPQRLVITPDGDLKAEKADPPPPKPQRLVITADAEEKKPAPATAKKTKPAPRRMILKKIAQTMEPRRLPASWDEPGQAPELSRNQEQPAPMPEDKPASIPWPTMPPSSIRQVAAFNAPERTDAVPAPAQPAAKKADSEIVPVSWQERGPALPLPTELPDVLPAAVPPALELDGKSKPLVIHVNQGGSLVMQTPEGKPAIRQAGAEMLEIAPSVLHDSDCSTPACSSGFIFLADFLYLRPRTSALPYSGIVTNVGGTTQPNSFIVDAVETGLDWGAGIRIGANYRTAGGWTFSFMYTHLDSEGSTTLGNPLIDSNSIYAGIVDRSMLPSGDGLADAAFEARTFDYDVYDLAAGMPFSPYCGLDCVAYAGFRAAEIDNHSTLHYYDIAPGFNVDAPIIRNLTMQAWGARGGLAGRYALGRTGLAICADGDLSLLYAEFEAQRYDSLIGIVNNAPFSVVQVYRSNVNGIVPVLGLRLSLSYNRGPLLAAAGYEFSHWFNFYQHADLPGTSPVIPTYRLDRGDLSLDGWFLRAGFRY